MLRFDASIETMKASRPLVEPGWVGETGQQALEIFDGGVLSLEDEVLEDHALIMMDPEDIAGMHIGLNGVLECMRADELVSTAAESMPESFGGLIVPKLAGTLVVREARRQDGSSASVLMAPVKAEEPLPDEKTALMDATNLVAGRSQPRPPSMPEDAPEIVLRLPWRGSSPNRSFWIRLAVVDGYYMSEDPKMRRLAKSLPADTPAGPGNIEAVMGYRVHPAATAARALSR